MLGLNARKEMMQDKDLSGATMLAQDEAAGQYSSRTHQLST